FHGVGDCWRGNLRDFRGHSLALWSVKPQEKFMANLIKLSGTPIGSPGSWQNSGNVAANAFDGNTATFFDAPTGTGQWCGKIFPSPTQITKIRYFPRNSSLGPGRMV